MKIYNFKDMIGGWFIGDFEPSVLKTKDFEVCYKFHSKGEVWPKHYHKIATEINLLVSGKMKIRNQIIEPDTIFVFDPEEVADPEFLEDCFLVIVKTPSAVGDKYEC
jgi:hypothetical protein